ncbi:predicted protein [Histoplasma capsulatum var. duboisii H88]|uniref:Predicted protein n=1 Tax=Ajellomyces capsulatus (strain H88) TaxID=544711 RepID=F0U6F7_AJEC8|nr:predicted protein [Histoplasma capsulatum var. duboisii H88]
MNTLASGEGGQGNNNELRIRCAAGDNVRTEWPLGKRRGSDGEGGVSRDLGPGPFSLARGLCRGPRGLGSTAEESHGCHARLGLDPRAPLKVGAKAVVQLGENSNPIDPWNGVGVGTCRWARNMDSVPVHAQAPRPVKQFYGCWLDGSPV